MEQLYGNIPDQLMNTSSKTNRGSFYLSKIRIQQFKMDCRFSFSSDTTPCRPWLVVPKRCGWQVHVNDHLWSPWCTWEASRFVSFQGGCHRSRMPLNASFLELSRCLFLEKVSVYCRGWRVKRARGATRWEEGLGLCTGGAWDGTSNVYHCTATI